MNWHRKKTVNAIVKNLKAKMIIIAGGADEKGVIKGIAHFPTKNRLRESGRKLKRIFG